MKLPNNIKAAWYCLLGNAVALNIDFSDYDKNVIASKKNRTLMIVDCDVKEMFFLRGKVK